MPSLSRFGLEANADGHQVMGSTSTHVEINWRWTKPSYKPAGRYLHAHRPSVDPNTIVRESPTLL